MTDPTSIKHPISSLKEAVNTEYDYLGVHCRRLYAADFSPIGFTYGCIALTLNLKVKLVYQYILRLIRIDIKRK